MNNKDDFRIVIASLPNRDNLVAEIYYNGIQWVEISKEKEQALIQFYTHPYQNYWEFSLQEAIDVLERAKKKFLNF